jgi:hypothetical protein
MNDEARALVAKLRAQVLEMNADIQTLATEHNVETEASMDTFSCQCVGEPQVVFSRRINLSFALRL